MNEPIDGRSLTRIQQTSEAVLNRLATLAEALELDQREALSGITLALASMIEATEPPENRKALRAVIIDLLMAGAEFKRRPSHG